jgi:AraC-like DNA-binding protein
MNNNILLNAPNVRFELHRSTTPEFPFIIHPNTYRSRNAFSLHENVELLYFLDGKGHMIYDNEPIPVHKGDIVVVNSYSLHQVVPDGEMPHFCLIIGKSFCRYNDIDPSQLIFQALIRDNPQVSSLFQQVMDAYANREDSFGTARIKQTVLDLLLHLCLHYSTPRPVDRLTQDPALEHVHRATDYMKANMARKLTADEIAASAGLSKFHFLREFKRITGYTLIDYLNTIRCDYARSLLESGRYSVKEVAFQCGFTNNSYFSNVFRQRTGLLPSQVRPHRP